MVSLIPLTLEDAGTLEKIHKACFPDGWNQETFHTLFMERNVCGWLAITHSNEPVGFILARVVGHEAEILTFAVHPNSQRMGTGRYLLKELTNFLTSVKCSKVFLEVAIDNASAIALYKSMNFQIVGNRPDYYKRKDNTLIHAYIMSYEY